MKCLNFNRVATTNHLDFVIDVTVLKQNHTEKCRFSYFRYLWTSIEILITLPNKPRELS